MAIFKADKHKKQQSPVLLQPPLLESVFELRWELEQDPQSGRLRDPSYPMMYGRLYEKFKNELPFIEDLPSTQIHPEANPFVVRHRIRKEKEGWPLIQIGPGILTINETKNYSWTPYRSLIARTVEAVGELFPKGTFGLNFIKCELRYVNGIPFDPKEENPLSFLSNKLHTKIDIDPEIFELNDASDSPISLGLNVLYPLQKPVGHLGLSFNLGQAEGKPAYILQTMIQSLGETVPQDRDSFVSWLNISHETAENCFQTLCRGPLMNRFASIAG